MHSVLLCRRLSLDHGGSGRDPDERERREPLICLREAPEVRFWEMRPGKQLRKIKTYQENRAVRDDRIRAQIRVMRRRVSFWKLTRGTQKPVVSRITVRELYAVHRGLSDARDRAGWVARPLAYALAGIGRHVIGCDMLPGCVPLEPARARQAYCSFARYRRTNTPPIHPLR